MKTKNIIKALAFVILVPAMLLNTACSSEITNIEDTDAKGYTLPVTVNVSRQGDDPATKATYAGNTLSFSSGDKLFVNGTHTTAGQFAGTLTWTSGGIFSGTITTQYEYTGTADALFTAASTASATLLPDGYGTYGFLSITANSGYDATVATNYLNAFATSKAAAVEQLSYEAANSYSSGFVLNPANAILNFTITGLPASTEVAVVMKKEQVIRINKSLTTDGSGTATFAVGIYLGRDLNDYTLTVGGNAITLVTESKTLTAGKIYNITRAVPLPGVFTVDAGKTVKFSKGNLRYVSGAWSFFDHQYDYYATYSADAWDKFGWSNSTNNFGMRTSKDNADYKGDLVDWGTVPGIGSGWYTLSNSEWGCLLNTRSASTVNSVADARYAKGKVNGVYGIILFPDTYTHPAGVTLPVGINDVGNTGWNGNNYSAAEWTAMETAGCVFLPATGYRDGTSVQSANSSCSYRSSSRANTESVKYVYFTATSLNANTTNYGYYGQCVRLVKDVN